MIAPLLQLLASRRFSLSSEIVLQEEMHAELVAAGMKAEREVRLNASDIIDIVVDGAIGIECKIKGQKRAIYHQVERYAQHDSITHLILATSVAMGFPGEINGKPVYVLNLSRAWL